MCYKIISSTYIPKYFCGCLKIKLSVIIFWKWWINFFAFSEIDIPNMKICNYNSKDYFLRGCKKGIVNIEISYAISQCKWNNFINCVLSALFTYSDDIHSSFSGKVGYDIMSHTSLMSTRSKHIDKFR